MNAIQQSDTFAIDPFALWPLAASRIRGLGGDAAPIDPSSVFHTAYAMYDAGIVSFDLAFEDLTASSGTMSISVMAIPAGETDAHVALGQMMALRDLVNGQGCVRLSIAAVEGTLYALQGRILDETDAAASALTIQSDRRSDSAAFERKLEAARLSIYRPRRSGTGALVVDRPATLARPLSQMCTVAQFDEPEYQRWIDEMHRPMHRHRKQWEYVYICRTLEHMGMLQPRFRGLGFGCGIEPLPALFAVRDMFVTASDLADDDARADDWRATAQHSMGLTQLRDVAICPDEIFDARVEFMPIDMTQIPADRRGYDFCWSSCSLEHLGTIAKGLEFIERSLDTLRPGGVAVHTTELNLTSDRRTMSKGSTVLFRRRDIEAFAIRLEALGHEVVPITFDQGDQPADRIVDVPPYSNDHHFKLALGQFVSTSFGLAVRKAPRG